MTPKLLMAFLLTAVLPVLAASVFSLTFFYGAAYDNARRNLARELATARHFVEESARRLKTDTQLASRENVVSLNLSLGLTAPVLDYLDNLRRERKLALATILDAEGRPVGGTSEHLVPADTKPLVTSDHLSLARSQEGLGFQTTLEDGRVLLVAVVPVFDELGQVSHFLVTAVDPAAGTQGGILDEIQQVVSGPVVLGNSHGLLGVSPGSPPWSAETQWPTALPGHEALFLARTEKATYLFGFERIGDTGPEAWVGVSFSLDAFQQVTNAAAGGLIVLAFLAVTLSFGAALAFSRGLTRPLMRMAEQAGAWTEGQGGNRLDVTAQDETGILGRAFNEVLDRLDVTLESLRKTQSYLKNIFNSLTSVLVSIDENGIVQEWNTAAEQFSGLAASQAIGKKVRELSPVFEGLESSLFLAATTREPQYLKKPLGRGHEQKTFDLCLYPLVWNGVSGVVIRVDDITESLRKDRQLLQAQKMETVGTLTEGIAHNFNNLLTGINGTVSLVGMEIADGPLDRDLLRSRIAMIEDSTHRAAEIVRRLMALSKGGTGEFVPVDLAAVVREVAKTSRMVLDNTVELDVSVPDHAYVHGDRSQLEQCLLNLVINAAHAMTIMRPRGEHSGGTVRISITAVSTPKDFLLSHTELPQGTYWLLRVQDTGVGISPKNLSKIFDPFYTTKDSDKGSGLGLAMVYNSIRQHKGFIDVYSEVGRGTSFSLNLPILEDTGQVSGALPPRAVETYQRGQGLVLVVDDERVVQATAQMILQACGYEVVTANNGLEALAVYEAQQDKIRAVLLDSSMPKLSGAETLAALKKINPQIRVVLTSGLFSGSQIDEVSFDSLVRFLPKPYSLSDLSRVFHDLLGGPV